MDPEGKRPRFAPGYGIHPDGAVVPWSHLTEQMVASRNYWVASTRPDGRPHVAPVWGLWVDGRFWFSSDPASRKGKNLEANPRIVVHLESGDNVVMVEGVAERITDPAKLQGIADLYEAKYGFKVDISNAQYGFYAVRPDTAFAWLEKDFPGTATRWALSS